MLWRSDRNMDTLLDMGIREEYMVYFLLVVDFYHRSFDLRKARQDISFLETVEWNRHPNSKMKG